MLISATSPSAIASNMPCSFAFCWSESLFSLILASRVSANSFALRSFSTTNTSSPAFGTPDRPSTTAGIEGPADLTLLDDSSYIARTRPNWVPASSNCPCFNKPDCTSTVATGPRPLSSVASTTIPLAFPLSTASSSRISACSRIASSKASTPSPVIAETLTKIFSPPHSSGITSSAARSFFTLSGSAFSLSILLTAMTIGTPAARACSTASLVCGIAPSSAATTSTTISVAWAPRARIAENAAWPGVSRNVIIPLSVSTWYAPMCWVIPPASPEVTRDLRM